MRIKITLLLLLSLLFLTSFNEVQFPYNTFEKNSTKFYKPKEDSATINLLMTTLIENPKIIIELSGHSCYDEIDTTLSLRRAKLVKKELINRGIESERLVPVGYQNKRLKYNEKAILTLSSESEKQAMHTKNRRVVYSVLSWDFPTPSNKQ